jgi:hypothetical protein
MTVSVIVPFRPDGGHRSRNWTHLRAAWKREHPDWELIEGHCPDGGPWVKALAVQDGLSRASGDVLVLADADVWCDGLREAVDAVGHARWAHPHLMVHRLTEAATDAVLRGEPIDAEDTEQRPYEGVLAGGLTVIQRSLYEEAPLDPRFRGWGQEDVSVALAWLVFGGKPWRGFDPLWHFWHPAPPRKNRSVGTDDGMALYRRYTTASHQPAKMREIISEFKGVDT